MLTVKVIWRGFRLTVLTLALASMGVAPSGANPQEPDPQPILASELDINRYSTDASDLADPLSQTSQGMEQITSVSELSDVNPDDWAYQALQGLVERYGCIVGYPNLTFNGDRPLSRWEFAAGLNACMGAMERLLQENVAVLSQDVEQLKRLTQAFEVELVSLKGRIDNTETRLSFLEDH
ncbi:MAG: iron uptake porin, partial [Synechocystis sp.]